MLELTLSDRNKQTALNTSSFAGGCAVSLAFLFIELVTVGVLSYAIAANLGFFRRQNV